MKNGVFPFANTRRRRIETGNAKAFIDFAVAAAMMSKRTK
jgi:hypothetical protein